MSFIELILIAAGLSMDAFAVALCDGLVMKRRSQAVLTAGLFGLFQAVMPIIGYLLGAAFAKPIEKYDHIIALAVLGFIGGRMIIEGISELGGRRDSNVQIADAPVGISLATLLVQAAATSIDAFVVGVSLAAVGAEIVPAAAAAGAVTFCLSLAGALGGARFGVMLGTKAELLGGAILVATGIKTFAEHMLSSGIG